MNTTKFINNKQNDVNNVKLVKKNNENNNKNLNEHAKKIGGYYIKKTSLNFEESFIESSIKNISPNGKNNFYKC